MSPGRQPSRTPMRILSGSSAYATRSAYAAVQSGRADEPDAASSRSSSRVHQAHAGTIRGARFRDVSGLREWIASRKRTCQSQTVSMLDSFDMNVAPDLAKMFKALGDPTRLRLLSRIMS